MPSASASLPPIRTTQSQRDLTVAREDRRRARGAGQSFRALESYEAGLPIRERLAAADPGNTEWQRDLSVSHNRIGDVRRAQGNLSGALESYEAGRAIAERLASPIRSTHSGSATLRLFTSGSGMLLLPR